MFDTRTFSNFNKWPSFSIFWWPWWFLCLASPTCVLKFHLKWDGLNDLLGYPTYCIEFSTAGFEACLFLHCRHMDWSYRECNSCYLSFHSTSLNLDDLNRVVYVVSLFDQDEVCVSRRVFFFFYRGIILWNLDRHQYIF